MNTTASECSGQLDELTRFLHSAWSSWCHKRNTITEFDLLAFYWLTISTCWLRSFGNDVRKFLIVSKSRDTAQPPIYIRFALKLQIRCNFANYSNYVWINAGWRQQDTHAPEKKFWRQKSKRIIQWFSDNKFAIKVQGRQTLLRYESPLDSG